MHELAVTENILRIVAEHAGGARVTDIHLVIGEMSSFVDDSIQFYFSTLAAGTAAEQATLHFRRIAIRFRCRSCAQEFAPTRLDWRCPACGAMGGEVIAGKEFYVESIEVTGEK